MALTYGQQWAIYMLLAQHDGVDGIKSQFRTDVENLMVQRGMAPRDAVIQTAQASLANTIRPADFGPIPSLAAEDLRTGLGMGIAFYIPGSGTCPDAPVSAGQTLNHQKAIAAALLAMTGPVLG